MKEVTRENLVKIFSISITYLISILAYSFNQGFFSVGGLLFLSLVLFAIILFNFNFSFFHFFLPEKKDCIFLLAFILFISLGLSNTLIDDDMNGFLSLAMFLERFLLIACFLLSLSYFLPLATSRTWPKIFKLRFPLLFLFAFLIRIALLRVHLIPSVDVFHLMKNGPLALLSGKNPYLNPYSVKTLKDSWQEAYEAYVYGPASLFWFLPFDYFLKDPRWLIILAELIVGLLIRFLLKDLKGELAVLKELLPLIFLFNPLFYKMVVDANMESLLFLFFLVGFMVLVSKQAWWTAYFWFGTAIAMKWTYGLGLFFIKHQKRKRYFLGAGVLIFTILLYYYPFLKLDSEALYKSLVKHEMRGGLQWLFKSSLTWQTFCFRQFHTVPPLLIWAAPVGIIFLLLRWKTKNNLVSLSLNMGGGLLAFYLLSHQGLFNYYMFVSFCLLLAIVFSLFPKKTKI